MKINGGSNSHVLTTKSHFVLFKETTINIQTLSGTSSVDRGYSLAIIQIPSTQMIIPLWPTYYMPDNPQNTLSQNALKSYNEFRSVRTESLGWIHFVNSTSTSARIHTNLSYHLHQRLDYIDVDLMFYKFHSTTPTVNTSFSKQNLNWTIIHRRCEHVSDDKLATMCRKKTILDLPSTFSSKHQLHKCQCWICWEYKSKYISHGPTMDNTPFSPSALLHLDYMFINTPSIRGFTSIIIIVDAKTLKLWLFCTPNKTPPIDTIHFFLHKLQKQGISVINIRTDECGELYRCTQFCEVLYNEFHVTLQTTGGYSSWLNGKSERHIQTISNMIHAAFYDSGLPMKLWCFNAEYQAYIYNSLLHTATNEQPEYYWYGIHRSIHDLHIWGCSIHPITPHPTKLQPRTSKGYFMGITSSQSIIKWWDIASPNKIKYCTSAKFNEYLTYIPNGDLSPGSIIMQGKPMPYKLINMVTIDCQKHPFLNHPPLEVIIKLPPKGRSLGIKCFYCAYHELSYIKTIIRNNVFY